MRNEEFAKFAKRRDKMAKLNTEKGKVGIEALARRKDGGKEQMSDVLTEGEKVQMAVMVERLNNLQAQLDQIRRATADLITSIVTARGLDPQKYGVNLAAGRILPVEGQQPVVSGVKNAKEN